MWRASAQDIGGTAIAFGILSTAAVTARICLARRRKLVLRTADWLIIVSLLPVLALCIWDALGGLSHVLRFMRESGLAFSFHHGEGVNNRGLAAMMIIHVVASIILLCSVLEFYQRLLGLKKNHPVVYFFSIFAGAAYGVSIAYYISALFYVRAAIVAGFTVGIAALNLLVILVLIFTAGASRSRLPTDELGRKKIWIVCAVATFLVASAVAHLAFAVMYLTAYFDSDDYFTFQQIRENAAQQYFYIADTTLWGLLTITTWTVLACIPTFAPEIQHLSNQARHVQAWPQQAMWQQTDPSLEPRPTYHSYYG